MTSPSATSFTPDPHTVSHTEAQAYYSGLASEPKLVYRTGAPWSPPHGPEAQRRRKELREVYNHPLVALWNDGLAWKVVDVMDAHGMVDFDEAPSDEEEGSADEDDAVGPVTIWVGVMPTYAAKVVLGLLSGHQITDVVDVDFRESLYRREAGPQLLSPVGDLDPLVDVISPPHFCPRSPQSLPRAGPRLRAPWASTSSEDGESDSLLGLTCNHVPPSIRAKACVDYVYHPSAPAKNVVLLCRKAYDKLAGSQIQSFVEREKAKKERTQTQALLDDGETALAALADLLDWIRQQWKSITDRVLGHIIRAPAIRLGVSEERFTEDPGGGFRLSRDKLGHGFQGNKIDLGACGNANWCFEYPEDRLLPIHGIISDELMRAPDMWDLDGESCLLVVKNGNATNTTLGRANGVFSIVREYAMNTDAHHTSMEWGIVNYDSKSDFFSEPGDSGVIIADILWPHMTYATPFWWSLRRIEARGLPGVNLNVFE
ncbi:hypothetical protein H4582DRAFT_2121694 [Lactarius indigo]|nr:hypothetical protein H4582DRAFT_2121694 [Lactarius indigo]